MKICFAIDNLQAGGAERVFSELVNWFVENTIHDVYVHMFSYLRNKPYFYRVDKRIRVVSSFYEDCDAAAKVLREQHPDCVVSFLNPMNYVMSVASHEVGIPHIACERNNPYYSPQRLTDRANRDEAFRKAAGCVFQTASAASYFLKFALAGEVKIIQNPVCVRKLWEERKENKIVAVGRYADQKNYPVLLEAFHEFRVLHPDYSLDCYGKDSGKLNDIKSIAISNKWDEGVSFHEPVEFIHKEMGSAKLFLMTSLYEGMPNALAEAAALGLPCVAVDVPGVGDLVKRYQCGLLCQSFDPKVIAALMDDLVCNDILYSELSRNGRLIKETVGIEKIAPIWISFIEDIVSRHT